MSGREIRGMSETERLLLEGVNRSGSDLHIHHSAALSRPWRIYCAWPTETCGGFHVYGETLAEAAGAMVERLIELEEQQGEES